MDWEDHSTLLYRSWFDHFAGWNSPTYFCPTAEISQSKFHLPAQFLHPCKFYSSKSISSPHLTQSNSFREPKRFASFYRCCRYYSLLQKEQSMGKKQQERDKISLLFITVWINSSVVHTSMGGGGGRKGEGTRRTQFSRINRRSQPLLILHRLQDRTFWPLRYQ